jgi:dipeptidyl aminopeptidase/acylaminoacyl peptidase
MHGWLNEPPTRNNYGAIKMIALFLIIFIMGCNTLTAPQTNPTQGNPLQISEEPSAQPFFTPSKTIISSSESQHVTPINTEIPSGPTPAPTLTRTPETPAEITTFVPILGGADQIAFIEQNEIWMANLDGSALTQLTQDGIEKSSLQWSPSGEKLFFISEQCINFISFATSAAETLACFEEALQLDSFQISPDGTQAAVSLGGELYVVPYDQAQLSQASTSADLAKFGTCGDLSPYKHRQSMVHVIRTHWSDDGNRLAILRTGYEDDQEVELVQILDISRCTSPIPRLDEFPATRIEMENYARIPIIQNFAWDGGDLFALTDFKRNDGFGDLWIYNTHLYRGFKANPIDDQCCYRDPVFSPDGKYLAFAFQDASLASGGGAVIYYLPYAAIDSSLVLPPLALPDDFFSEPRSKPQPALRPAP